MVAKQEGIQSSVHVVQFIVHLEQGPDELFEGKG
jgi:hypothetical protein